MYNYGRIAITTIYNLSWQRETLLSLSPLLVIAHSNYTGLLNCPSFFIRLQGWRIFDDEFIIFDMLNGQCSHWCVYFSSMTQQFFSTRWFSALSVDFWWHRDYQYGFSLKSQQRVRGHLCPGDQDGQVSDHNTTILQGSGHWGQKQFCSKYLWVSTQEAWLKALWHAGMLASMQRKSTNSISLIRASGSLPPKRKLTVSAWPSQSSRLCGDEEQGQMRPVPNTHSFTLPRSFTRKQNTKDTYTERSSKGQDMGV